MEEEEFEQRGGFPAVCSVTFQQATGPVSSFHAALASVLRWDWPAGERNSQSAVCLCMDGDSYSELLPLVA